MRSPRGRAGATLLEVLVALAILGIAGIGALQEIATATSHFRSASRAEREVEEANRVLSAWTLLSQEELDQRLGRQAVGEFVVDTQRPEVSLYRIGIALARASDRELLSTVVYRGGRLLQ